MALDFSLDPVDEESQRTCPTCNARMSSISNDKHSVCVSCRGVDCTFEKRCDECFSWDEEVKTKYVKHRKSLLSKSRSRSKDKRPSEVSTSSVRLCSSSKDSCATLRVLGIRIPCQVLQKLG